MKTRGLHPQRKKKLVWVHVQPLIMSEPDGKNTISTIIRKINGRSFLSRAEKEWMRLKAKFSSQCPAKTRGHKSTFRHTPSWLQSQLVPIPVLAQRDSWPLPSGNVPHSHETSPFQSVHQWTKWVIYNHLYHSKQPKLLNPEDAKIHKSHAQVTGASLHHWS